MMKKKMLAKAVKVITAIAGTVIGNELKMIAPAMLLLVFLMAVDYISGMLAAKKESVEHPGSKRYGWSSKKSIMGIYKKVGYILTVLAAVSTDYTIYVLLGEMGFEYRVKTVFGFLVTVWLVINEVLSILENTGRMGVKLPLFLMNILAEMKTDVDNYGRK